MVVGARGLGGSGFDSTRRSLGQYVCSGFGQTFRFNFVGSAEPARSARLLSPEPRVPSPESEPRVPSPESRVRKEAPCRRNEQWSGRERRNEKAKRRPLRRVSSFARRSNTFARGSTEHARRNRRSPSDCRKPDELASSFRRRRKAGHRRGRGRVLRERTERGRAAAVESRRLSGRARRYAR